jgi:hypothetical protein
LEQYKFKEKNDIFIIKLPYVGFLLCWWQFKNKPWCSSNDALFVV